MAPEMYEPHNISDDEMLEGRNIIGQISELQKKHELLAEKLHEVDRKLDESVASLSAGDYLCVASNEAVEGLKVFLRKNPAWDGIIAIHENVPMESRNDLFEKVINVVGNNEKITVEISKE